MSAENAWKVAMEAAARLALVPPQGDLEHDMACEAHGRGIAHDIECLPMPPAFRAEVEAKVAEAIRAEKEENRWAYVKAALEDNQTETEELRGMLAWTLDMLEQLEKESGRGVEWGEEDAFRMGEWFDAEDLAKMAEARALLSRLEAKGESHE